MAMTVRGKGRGRWRWFDNCSSGRSTIGQWRATTLGFKARPMTASDNIRTFVVDSDDDGIRLDRWFKRHLPDVSFNLVSRWARTGQLRVDGKRATPGDRVEAGQSLRVP